ncbi:alcohol dehydrogenase AdhP [Aestuariivirga litoralis]|uniref:alcohol dehydrogenase n=1 Tax=Aestuariivirga litoralis TaxID=2650924 RepID=A0A2W2B019_9HYPH|nr:alcohol dehydrogenase AdhP [Aestuariivirga litoralis]PZF78220.1 alcohol dehydrogenase AdhP [Aestuariivirga litoralis]
MTQTMKAAVLHELRTPLKIERVPVPEPGHGDLLIKVTACGVCHSDLHAVDGDWTPLPVIPLIPGHEVAGKVAKVGPGVTGFKVGDEVGVPWMYSSCGQCEFCLAGMETICKSAEATGYTKPGGYAEYLVAPAAYVGRLPEGTDPYAMAPILCAGVTTYRGLKRTGARPGQWVAVVGIGGLGHIAIQYARAMGLRVAAVDVSKEKLDLATSLGAEIVVNGAETDPAAAIQEQIGGTHAAVVTAVAAKAFEQAVLMLRPGGTVAYIGLPGGKSDEIRASISAITNWELSVRGSNVGTRQDLNEAIAFAANGLVKATIRTAELEEINAVFEEMRKGRIVGRVVLKMA